jgi:NAD(P)-dependent dehydrogenase (short-subunit alcohol dehydrogenase family)
MDVKGQVVLVAGAANDIGAAISEMLSNNGATIALADSNFDAIANLEKKIVAGGKKAKAYKIEMLSVADVESKVKTISAELGSIDVLVNAIDIQEKQPVTKTNIDHWRSLVETNLTSVFLITKAVIPLMKEKNYGRIITLNDFDYLGMPGSSSYSAIKSGIFGFTRAIALELAANGITVNSVVKGEIKPKDSELSDEERSAAEKRMPVGRIGTVEDIAYAVSFFASKNSKYLTGQTLFVCGGKSLYASMSI